MPVTGPAVHQQLLSAYKEIQDRLDSMGQQVAGMDQKREQLSDDRGAALVSLAEHYLPDLTHESIQETWREARVAISDVLLRKEDHQRRIRATMGDLRASQSQHDRDLVTVGERLDAANEDVDRVAAKVESKLQADSDFVRLSGQAARAEVALERAEANLDEIEQDAATKLPAYESSSLFSYLRDRGFGTEAYGARGFTRRTDRWLAKLIGFYKANQSYQFLKQTPQTMQQIIVQDRQAIDTVMNELERIRNEVADELGLTELANQADTLQTQRADLLDEIELLREKIDATATEQAELEQARGTYYREAVDLFRQTLQRCDTGELKQRARVTPDITDDQIVARLSGIDSNLEDADRRSKEFQGRITDTQSLLKGMGQVIQRFRAAQYDSGRSQFIAPIDVVSAVRDARDEYDLDYLWTSIRRSHRWGPSTMDRITQVATHPMTQVLINAMAHAAGGALQEHARRAGRRRR